MAYGPGGGYDKVARLLAKHLPKRLPGKPSVIVAKEFAKYFKM